MGKEPEFSMRTCTAAMRCYATASLDADKGCCETRASSWILCHHLNAIRMATMWRKSFHSRSLISTTALQDRVSAPFRLMRRLRIKKVKRLAQGHKASKVEELSLKPESHDSRPQRKKGGGKKADSTQQKANIIKRQFDTSFRLQETGIIFKPATYKASSFRI